MPPSLMLLNRIFWTTSGLLCIAVLLLAFWNGRLKPFPLFFSLVGWYPVDFALFFAAQRVRSFEVWVWCTSFLMVTLFLLELVVLYELAKLLIFSHRSLGTRLKTLPNWTLAVLVLLATVLAALARDGSSDHGASTFAKLGYAEDVIETGLLLATVLLTRILGISWRSLPAGIALGWGISSLFDLGAVLLIKRGHDDIFLRQDIIRAVGFNACVLVWLWYTLRPELIRASLPPDLGIGDLQVQTTEDLHRILRM